MAPRRPLSKAGRKRAIGAALVAVVAVIFATGFLLPEQLTIPVKGATARDWNHRTFWFEPWGASGVHKGIDIFSPPGTPVIASSYGIVVYAGRLGIGGNAVAVLGPKWRIHYYAHLRSIDTFPGAPVRAAQPLGTVGDSGNAQGKPPHLHYTILSIAPYFSRWDDSPQGWKKMFFLNPSEELTATP